MLSCSSGSRSSAGEAWYFLGFASTRKTSSFTVLEKVVELQDVISRFCWTDKGEDAETAG